MLAVWAEPLAPWPSLYGLASRTQRPPRGLVGCCSWPIDCRPATSTVRTVEGTASCPRRYLCPY
eukprot:356358-Chlamydomonas_euryale.AAC.1